MNENPSIKLVILGESFSKYCMTKEFYLFLFPLIFIFFYSDAISSCSAIRFPVPELLKVCREHGVLVHVDGAHAPGQIPLELEALGADFYTGLMTSLYLIYFSGIVLVTFVCFSRKMMLQVIFTSGRTHLEGAPFSTFDLSSMTSSSLL